MIRYDIIILITNNNQYLCYFIKQKAVRMHDREPINQCDIRSFSQDEPCIGYRLHENVSLLRAQVSQNLCIVRSVKVGRHKAAVRILNALVSF
jgi:hypothetical protein